MGWGPLGQGKEYLPGFLLMPATPLTLGTVFPFHTLAPLCCFFLAVLGQGPCLLGASISPFVSAEGWTR